MITTPSPRDRRKGFTLLELTLVAALMAFMLLLVSGVWHSFSRSMRDTVALGRLSQEASLAVESLSRDLSGGLPEQVSGGKRLGRLVDQSAAAGPELRLCYDGDGDSVADWASPDVVVSYAVASQQLVRSYDGSPAVVIADGVDHMELTTVADGLRIDLTFRYRTFTKTYTLITMDP
jgi:prepilin-type N-terminal cleavage/methylation domain-containing protein